MIASCARCSRKVGVGEGPERGKGKRPKTIVEPLLTPPTFTCSSATASASGRTVVSQRGNVGEGGQPQQGRKGGREHPRAGHALRSRPRVPKGTNTRFATPKEESTGVRRILRGYNSRANPWAEKGPRATWMVLGHCAARSSLRNLRWSRSTSLAVSTFAVATCSRVVPRVRRVEGGGERRRVRRQHGGQCVTYCTK